MNLRMYIKGRWWLIAIIVATPVAITAGHVLWTASSAPERSDSPSAILMPPVELDGHASLHDQIDALRRRLAAPHPDGKILIDKQATLLLQLGDLERAVENPSAADKVYCMVVELRNDGTHWQSREAQSRLSDLKSMAGRPANEVSLWQHAFEKQRQAERLHDLGSFREAIEATETALQMRRELWGNEHPETSESLLRLGWLCTEHADFYLRAEGLIREAADHISGAWGLEHPASGDCSYLLAGLADDRGDFAAADRLFEQALDTYKNSEGEFSRRYARALNRQGRMHVAWWKDFAHGKVAKALQIREQILGQDDPDCAESLEDLGRNAQTLYDFELAKKLLARAVELRTAKQGSAHPDLAGTQMLLANCLAEQGDMAQAYVMHRHALQRIESSRGEDHPLATRCRALLAMQYVGNSDCARAHRLFQQSLESLDTLGLKNHPDYAALLTERAECLRWEISQQDDAADQARASPGNTNFYLESAQTFEAAQAAFLSIPGGTQLPRYAYSLLQFAELCHDDDYRNHDRVFAQALLNEAERNIVANGGRIHPYYQELYYQQGKFLKSKGDLPGARKSLEKYRDVTNDIFGIAHPWRTLIATEVLGGIGLYQGAKIDRDLVPVIREAFQLEYSLFLKNASGQSDHSRIGLLNRCFYALSGHLSASELASIEDPPYEQILTIHGAASSLQAGDRTAHDHPELHSMLRQVREARERLKVVALSGGKEADSSQWQLRLEDAGDAKELAENELALAVRPFLKSDSPVTLEMVQSALPPRAVLIDVLDYFFHYPPPNQQGHLRRTHRLLAHVIRADRDPICVRLGSREAIEHAVEAWRSAIVDFQNGQSADIDTAARNVWRLVWQPLMPHIADAPLVLIAPTGPLCGLSFCALPGSQPGSYLLEEHAFGYVVSGRMVASLGTEFERAPNSILMVGGIEYRNSGPQSAEAASPSLRGDTGKTRFLPDGARWENLPATVCEIENVRDRFAESAGPDASIKVLSHEQANIVGFTGALTSRWRYVHFAGHGFFANPQADPVLCGPYSGARHHERYVFRRNLSLLSGLVLAPSRDRPQEPSIFTAEEVGSLDLRGTEMVVLSACETGLGPTAGGEGVIGLQRAFQTAGARSVVTSLWKVDDAATSLLMEEFYFNLWERKLSRWESLQQAQLTILKNPLLVSQRNNELALRGFVQGKTVRGRVEATDPSLSHPALWAAFILSGDGR